MNKEERLQKRIGYLVGQYESVIADFEAQIEDLSNRLSMSEARARSLESQHAQVAEVDPS